MVKDAVISKGSRIEKNIPLPKYTKMAPRYDLASDLRKMLPGDSVLIDLDYTKEALNSLRTRIDTIRKKAGLDDRKYTCNLDPVSNTKMRVWRVA